MFIDIKPVFETDTRGGLVDTLRSLLGLYFWYGIEYDSYWLTDGKIHRRGYLVLIFSVPTGLGNKLPMQWILNPACHEEEFEKCAVIVQFYSGRLDCTIDTDDNLG